MSTPPGLARFIALAVLPSLLPTAELSAAEAPPRVVAAVELHLRPLLREFELPGLAVGVTLGGRVHFFCFGLAAKEGSVPVTEQTLFEIGSISKTFTATLACLAEGAGVLSLENPAGQHLPELRGSALGAVPLRHFGTYTAGGLPLQFPAEVTSTVQMLAYLREWKPTAPPGTRRRYSNPSIGLLGHATAAAWKREFIELIEVEIIRPLGLKQTHLRIPASALSNYAWGYDRNGLPIRVSPGVFEAEAYGIKTSVADLLRWVEAQLPGSTSSAPLRRAIEGTHVGYFEVGPMVQGLGWEQMQYPVSLELLLAGTTGGIVFEAKEAKAISVPAVPERLTLYHKTGSTNGFGAYAAFLPAKRLGLVLLANKNIPLPARLKAAHAVLEVLSKEEPAGR